MEFIRFLKSNEIKFIESNKKATSDPPSKVDEKISNIFPKREINKSWVKFLSFIILLLLGVVAEVLT